MKRAKLRELEIMFRDKAYEAEFLSTAWGQEAHGIQKEAWYLEGLGQVERACSLLQRAAALIPEEDDGAAASSIRHDLAHMLSQACRPSDWQSLGTAVNLLRRALQSPARQAMPMRQAQSENSLAVCLRRLAMLARGEQRKQMQQEVEQRYRSVLFLAERSGMLGSKLLAETHLNLGNFLAYERGDTESAVRQYERAISGSLRATKQGHGHMRHVLCRARLCAAEVLRLRGRKKDLKAAERFAKEALQQPEKGREDHGWLVLAEIALAGDPPAPQRARELLVNVRTARLDESQLRLQHAELLWRAGVANEALGVLEDWIQSAIHARSRTIADFEADAASLDFQPAAALAARILVQDKADAVGAFLRLENASGLRFAEALSSFAWRPKDPLAHALQQELQQSMSRAYALDVFARANWGLEPAEQRARLKSMFDAVQQDDSDVGLEEMAQEDKSFLREALHAAISAPVPFQHLFELVRADEARVRALKGALRRHDTDYAASQRPLEDELDQEELRSLLLENPEQVLVRLSLTDDLLVVAVWLENGRVVARGTRLPIPDGLLQLLGELSSQTRDMDFDRLSALLARMDLSPALPEVRRPRAVLLPSNGAASLPLAVLGPKGRRLLDRFDSLVWLPGLFPLRTRPAASRPRAGHLVINPETTWCSPLAFAQRREGELSLSGRKVTPRRLKQVASEYQTLCIYTHGQHKPGHLPELMLADEQWLDVSRLSSQLVGLERMEIWACQTGANRPIDPFSPPADEGFGLDFMLLMHGVRSAIGTLCSVPDASTAAIVRQYRRRLSEGVDPAVALLDAQRWWEAEGLPLLAGHLAQKEHRRAVADFAAALEEGAGVEGSSAALLGTMAGRERSFYGCPAYWGAIRFVGLPERGPLDPWSELPERPLTDEEREVLEQCLSAKPASDASFGEQLDDLLAEVMALEPGTTPSVEQALLVARLSRERITGSYQDNLLVALAWLHEALVAPELAEGERCRLAVEAAHLWLDVAVGEQFPSSWPNPVALVRAERLLESIPGSAGVPAADGLAARARLHFLRLRHSPAVHNLLQSPREALRRLSASPLEALEILEPALDGVPAESYEALRIATISLELLPTHELIPESLRTRVLQRARALASLEKGPPWVMAAWQRLRGALGRFEPEMENARAAQLLSTPRELVEVTLRAIQREALSPTASTVATMKLVSEGLSRLESALWGHPSDNRLALVTTTGTLGSSYRELLGFYLQGRQLHQPDKGAAHALACLQSASDLRLSFLGRLALLAAQVSGELGSRLKAVSVYTRMRLAVHVALVDAALVPDPESVREALPRPHALDPYALPAQALHEGMKDFSGFTAWSLDSACGQWPEGLRPPRTAAFAAFLVSRTQEAEAARQWLELLEAEARMRQHSPGEAVNNLPRMLDPGLKLETTEEWLEKLPEGFGMMGLALGPLGHQLLVMACWSTRRGRGGRLLRIDVTGVKDALMGLLSSIEEDGSSKRGLSGSRREAWSKLEAVLAPVLDSLLKEAQREQKLRWGLLAPGALRALPLMGLRLGDGQMLAEHVEAFAHLPSFFFGLMGVPRELLELEKEFTACLMARDKARGTTCFGEAAMETLRRTYPPELVLDCAEPQDKTLTELEVLAPRMEEVNVLRIYGIGDSRTCNDTTAMLLMEGQRALTDRNTHHLFLPRCRVVELWACTSGWADVDRVLFDQADCLPGLVSSFLTSGALAVIDLAWPVHDLIKAMVCEQYGWQARLVGHAPESLTRAVWGVSEMLGMLRQPPAPTSVREVLSLLDKVRRSLAHEFGIDLSHVVPFEVQVESPLVAGLSGAELIDELCQPVHLGAFRWWGA